MSHLFLNVANHFTIPWPCICSPLSLPIFDWKSPTQSWRLTSELISPGALQAPHRASGFQGSILRASPALLILHCNHLFTHLCPPLVAAPYLFLTLYPTMARPSLTPVQNRCPAHIYPVNLWRLNWLVIPPTGAASIPLHMTALQTYKDGPQVPQKSWLLQAAFPVLPAFPYMLWFQVSFQPTYSPLDKFQVFCVLFNACLPELNPRLPCRGGRTVPTCTRHEWLVAWKEHWQN